MTSGLTFAGCSYRSFPEPFWDPSVPILEQTEVVRCEKFGGKPGTLIGKLCRSPPRKENENAGGSLITGGGSKHQSEFNCAVHALVFVLCLQPSWLQCVKL